MTDRAADRESIRRTDDLMEHGAGVSPSHTPHSTATRLKLGDSLPLFTGQNYNSVAAFIDETDGGTAQFE